MDRRQRIQQAPAIPILISVGIIIIFIFIIFVVSVVDVVVMKMIDAGVRG